MMFALDHKENSKRSQRIKVVDAYSARNIYSRQVFMHPCSLSFMHIPLLFLCILFLPLIFPFSLRFLN